MRSRKKAGGMAGQPAAARRVALAGLLTALALALAYLEALFPLQAVIPLPGIRLGLANIVTLMALLGLGRREAFAILTARCALQALLFGSVTSFCFSISGGLLAMLTMALLAGGHGRWFSVIGLSAAGAAGHQIGQLCCAAVFFGTATVFSYLPFLLLAGVISGCLTGVCCGLLLPRLERMALARSREPRKREER